MKLTYPLSLMADQTGVRGVLRAGARPEPPKVQPVPPKDRCDRGFKNCWDSVYRPWYQERRRRHGNQEDSPGLR